MTDRFVKSATTSVPVANSRAELERMLRRYGCSRFQVGQDYDSRQATVSFVVPDSPTKDAAQIPVQLVVRTHQVYDALYGQPSRRIWIEDRWKEVPDVKGYNEQKLAQAERVAWRQLILWVDAALSAATAGVQKISDAFLAHTLVRGKDGTVKRMTELLNQIGGGDWLALLPPAGEPNA